MGGVDGGGVAEAGRFADIVGGESDGEPAAVMSDFEVAISADSGDGPAVTVFDPVGGGDAQSAVVGPGDDHISDTGPVPVGQRHLGCCRRVTETMRAGRAIQFGDEVSSGGDHDRVGSAVRSENPSRECWLRPLTNRGARVRIDPPTCTGEEQIATSGEEPDALGHARVEARSGLRYSCQKSPRSSPPSTASVTPVM